MLKFDLTKPVQTRDGCLARILCTDRASTDYPVIALINNYHLDVYTLEGKWLDGQSEDADCDLINVPEKTSRFLNVYANGSCFEHLNLKSARGNADGSEGGTLELVFEAKKLVEVIQHG